MSRHPREGGRCLGLILALVGAACAQAAPVATVASDTHPAVQNEFRFDAAPVAGRPVGDEAATVRLDRGTDPQVGPFVEATNEASGGYVGLDLFHPAASQPVPTLLSCDYRADPTLKVNLFARVEHQDYELGFTGPRSDTGQAIWLGQLPDVVADGRWHHLEVPLLRLLRRQIDFARVTLRELRFENQHLGDYLLAGFGGNPQGARLALAHFYLGRPGPATARLRLGADGSADAWSVTLDEKPTGEAPERATQRTPELTLNKLADGTHWVHVRAHSPAGWGPTIAWRLDVDTRGPQVDRIEPATGAEAGPDAWRCRLADAGAGVNPRSVRVTVGEQSYRPGDEVVRYEPVDQTLELDLGRLGRVLGDGERVTVAVTAADELGNAMAQPVSASFVFRPKLSRRGPEAPTFAIATPGQPAMALPGDGTFESGEDEWGPFLPGSVIVERTDRTAAAGRYSLRLACTEDASPFTVFARRSPFDASRFRILSFDYKVPDRLRVDFLLKCQDRIVRVQFTERHDDETDIGKVPNVVQDNQWHHAQVDLYDLLSKRFRNSKDFTVDYLLLTGGNWTGESRRLAGNYAGTEYFLDNFQLVPLLGADTRLQWAGADPTGVAGAELAAGKQPDQLAAPQKVTGDGLAVEQLPQGDVYVQARLFDPQGNLSPPRLLHLLIDTGRPVVGEVWPADGSKAAPPTIGVALRDEHGAGLDESSLKFEVDGQDYSLDSRVLSYDRFAGKLVWDGRRADTPVIFPDGKKVTVKLKEARSLAGNQARSLPSWSFTMDWASDHRGPDIEVLSRTHAAFFQDLFEDPTPAWHVQTEGSAKLASQDDGRGEQGHALAITPAGDWVVWHDFERPYAASRFGWVAFDYRLPAGANLSLWVKGRKNEGDELPVNLPLTGEQALTADGQWHTALVPLQAMLAKDGKLGVPYITAAIGFGGSGGGVVMLDNVAVFREASSRLARLSWTAFDETGVKGYSTVLDQNPRTTPEAKVTTTETEAAWRDVPPGLSWFHIRAVDGAGNWGPTTHFLLKTPER